MSDLRGQDAKRLGYLRRLSHQQVWVPRTLRQPRHQTVTIFDWDDTLLCTSWIHRFYSKGGHTEVPAWYQNKFRSIERAASQLLELALNRGQVFIITNAVDGWIEHCAAQWLPGLLPILGRVPLISARTRFESRHPVDVSRWKKCAFGELQKKLPDGLITNLLSIGDSQFEMDAVHAMSKNFDEALVKTIKFKEHPTPEELEGQLQCLVHNFPGIVESTKKLKSHFRPMCSNRRLSC
jgi:hypothetical protein